MIITLKKNADKKQVDCLLGWLRDHKVTPHVSAGESETIIGCVGDVAKMVLTLFNYPGDFDLAFTHRKGGEAYSVSRLELAEAVGGLESVDGLSLAREFLQSQEDALPQAPKI